MILNERIVRLAVLADELHFGRAARRLHVTQPALSASLKGLEREIGARLFRRTSRRVELTPAGNLLAAEARRLMEESARAIALVRGCGSEIVGPVRIGYPNTINPEWLGELIAGARRNGFAQRELEFVGLGESAIVEGLAKGSLHASFLTGMLRAGDLPGFQYARLVREPFRIALHSGHVLAGRCEVGFDDIRDEPVVWLSPDDNALLHARFISACAARDYQPAIAQEAGSFHECAQFARAGVGIAFVPAFADPWTIALRDAPHIDYTLAYPGDNSAPAIGRFVRFIRHRIGGVHQLS
jgi:DNA-binding transcriptional LysR family regulator